MKHSLSVGFVIVLLVIAEKGSSTSLGHRSKTIGGDKMNYKTADGAVLIYQGKDSTYKYSPQEDVITKVMKSVVSCQAKHPISVEELAALKNPDTDVQFSRDGKCFFACIFKAADLLEDGKLNIENLDEYFDEDSSEETNYREIIENCNKEVPISEPDICEYAYKMTNCWIKKTLNA